MFVWSDSNRSAAVMLPFFIRLANCLDMSFVFDELFLLGHGNCC